MKLLIVFNFNNGNGNMVMDCDRFPCSEEDIRKIEKYIMESANFKGAVITNIVRLG